MRRVPKALLGVLGVFVALLGLHFPLLRLPYFWDEAGYYIPAALDFCREGLLIPKSTLPTGHTPLVMIYLGLIWRVFGFSPLVTRAAMIFVAAATVVSLYALGRRVAGREVAAWSAAFLALSPLFFAQSSLAHLDLTAGLLTTLAVLALLRDRLPIFALTASLAVLSKETAAVLLPVAWIFAWRIRRVTRRREWMMLAAPLLPLIAWALYYHHATGYWTGNPEYLEYNLYSTLDPLRFLRVLPRRLEKLLMGGFNWMLVVGSVWGFSWRRNHPQRPGEVGPSRSISAAGAAAGARAQVTAPARTLYFLTATLVGGYILMLSAVGGAVLPRYLLPVFPVFYLVGALGVWQLPKALARGFSLALVACFMGGWFINPPWAFPYEDNLAYADFIRLHQQAAHFLEAEAQDARVLTAWPASDELARPVLGYVDKPLHVVPLRSFSPEDFTSVSPESFDLLYLYSIQWKPKGSWLTRSAPYRIFQEHFLEAVPFISEEILVGQHRLRLLKSFERRGQWVRIYSKRPE